MFSIFARKNYFKLWKTKKDSTFVDKGENFEFDRGKSKQLKNTVYERENNGRKLPIDVWIISPKSTNINIH